MRNLDLALYTMQIWREAATNENKILKILASRDTMVDGTGSTQRNFANRSSNSQCKYHLSFDEYW